MPDIIERTIRLAKNLRQPAKKAESTSGNLKCPGTIFQQNG